MHGELPQDYEDKKAKIVSKHTVESKDHNERGRKIDADLAAAMYESIHALSADQRHAALCLSGGGIRSATFGLGVLQGLARQNLLDRFSYLSTVSGGGYIGSWLSAWIHRHPDGRQGVIQNLNSLRESKIDPECEPIRRLREYSNYLTPQMGLLSADTWTWVAIYFRNLILNWLILVPLLAAVFIIPRLSVAVIMLNPDNSNASLTGNWRFGNYSTLLLVIGFILAVMAIDYVNENLPSTGNNRDQGTFLRRCLLPLLCSAIALTTAWAWFCNTQQEAPSLLAFVIFGAGLHLGGCLMYLLRLRGKHSRRAVKEVLSLSGIFSLILIIAAGGVGGALVWLAATSEMFSDMAQYAKYYACLASPLLLTLFLLAATAYIGLASYSTSDADREWWSRSGGWTLIAVVAWTVISGLVVFGPDQLFPLDRLASKIIASLGGISGIITIFLGKDASTPANNKERKKASLLDTLKDNAVTIAAPIFAAFIVVLVSFSTAWLLENLGFTQPSAALLISVMIVLVALGLTVGCFVNANKFSLNGAYQSRIIRSYLGASRSQRTPNRFTGFDPADNVAMHELLKGEKTQRFEKPLHVVNIALNLVKGEDLAWQERKAESFTVTPLHSGSFRLGYRRSNQYGGRKGPDGGDGISLGTAVAISGAAASPNMGYHSSPVVTFLLALFNVRLGWWLGNPGKAGDKTFRKRGPTFAVGPLIKETFGLTNEKASYVYLSDGGHFENLGLYEMVLRRCRVIFVSDAGCDPHCNLEDLGNAIRKVRIDLGVPITFEAFKIYARDDVHKRLSNATLLAPFNIPTSMEAARKNRMVS